jgi:diguanylate cyclase
VVVLVLFIGLLNLLVGYAVAVSLGYGPPTLLDAWEGLTVEPHYAASTQSWDIAPEEPVEEAPEEPVEEPVEETPEEPVAEESPDEETPEEETPDDDSEDDEPKNVEIERPGEQFVETSVLNFKVAMIKSCIALSAIDTKLRVGPFETELIHDSLKELQDDCSAYMVEQETAAEQFSERVGELGELAKLGDEIEMTILEETAQIETTLSNISNMDFDSDQDVAGRRLLEELHNLLTARHKLQDGQDNAFVAIARQEDRLGDVEDRLKNDPLTRLPNRIGLETTFDTWWKDDWHKTRELCAMLVDLDGFSNINEDHGVLCGDRIIFRVARLIEAEVGKENITARFAGQRFMVVFKDVGPRAAAKKAETIRLSLEQTVFMNVTDQINLTLTGGLTAITPSDTPQSLLERLEKTIGQARDAGPNRLYLHDGRKAESIEFPSLKVEQRVIKVS